MPHPSSPPPLPPTASLCIRAVSPPPDGADRYYAFLRRTGARLSASRGGHPMPLPTLLGSRSTALDTITIDAAGVRLTWDPRTPPALFLAASTLGSPGPARVVRRLMSTLGRTLDCTVELHDNQGRVWYRYRPHAQGVEAVTAGAAPPASRH